MDHYMKNEGGKYHFSSFLKTIFSFQKFYLLILKINHHEVFKINSLKSKQQKVKLFKSHLISIHCSQGHQDPILRRKTLMNKQSTFQVITGTLPVTPPLPICINLCCLSHNTTHINEVFILKRGYIFDLPLFID